MDMTEKYMLDLQRNSYHLQALYLRAFLESCEAGSPLIISTLKLRDELDAWYSPIRERLATLEHPALVVIQP